MARKWNPKTDPVGKHEPIGRRLFDEPLLMGAKNQPSFKGLDLRHFEIRDDRELSLDRLGSTGVEKKSTTYLRPRAEGEGAKCTPPKKFNGWVHIRVSVLENGWDGHRLPVIKSPVEGDGLEENTHHAHIVVADDLDVRTAALYLRELFTPKPVTVEKVGGPQKDRIWKKAVYWIRTQYSRLLKRRGAQRTA
jgi:hypothetical protein